MLPASQNRQQPILTITTSKNWVLPPRPKNTRKQKDKKQKKAPAAVVAATSLAKLISHKTSNYHPPATAQAPYKPTDPRDLHAEIQVIERENYQLKTRLLSLIHDYKCLRSSVLALASLGSSSPAAFYDDISTARKRLYNEMGDPMNELITNMSGLLYKSSEALNFGGDAHVLDSLETLASPLDLIDFVKLDEEFLELDELADNDVDDEIDLASLSRLISPSASEAEENNSLMTSITRSTTVSTTSSIVEKRPEKMFKFFDLPTYSEDDYSFTFEPLDGLKTMSIIEEDHYNQVADFLEEKLLSNDVKYYVEELSK